MQSLKQALQNHRAKLAVATMTAMTSPAFAQYTAPAAFTTAVEDAIEAIGGLNLLLIGVAAAGVVGGIVVKFVKRIRSAG